MAADIEAITILKARVDQRQRTSEQNDNYGPYHFQQGDDHDGLAQLEHVPEDKLTSDTKGNDR